MSFGFAVGDFVILTQLAWTTVQNARQACGAHDELTREVSNLHIVLQRLGHEVLKPESLLNSGEDNRREEIGALAQGCDRVLRNLSRILDKYNALPEERRRVTRLWKKVRFGNGEMLELPSIRLELITHTHAATLFVNLLILGSQGKVEQQMGTQSAELKRIRQSLNWISASFLDTTIEDTVWTSYADDEKEVWRKFRRELVKKGFKSSKIERHKTIIMEYLTELGSRGVFDKIESGEETMSRSDPACTDMVRHPLSSDLNMEEEVPPRREATPSDALQHSINPYSYCLTHWDPQKPPILLVGSIFDMASICSWAYDNVCIYDQLHASRVPLGSETNYIATQIEELKKLLISFEKNFAVVEKCLSRTSGGARETLETYLKRCEETPKQFQKFVEEGEKRMLCARINRRIGEPQETGLGSGYLKLSEVEWRSRKAIETTWKGQPIETFGRRAGLDFVRDLTPKKGPVCSQKHSLIVLVHNLKKLDLNFKQDCESICNGISLSESIPTQPQANPNSSLSAMPLPPLSPSPSGSLESTDHLLADDVWRKRIIKVMGEAPIHLPSLETFLRAYGVCEADLESEIVKLIVETREVYPDGGKLASL